MKKSMFIPVAGLLLITGCGTPSLTSGTPSTPPTNHAGAVSSAASLSTNTTTNVPSQGTASTHDNTAKHQSIYLTVLPGGKLGSDGKKHDAFSPANFTLEPGVPVTLTIDNYDNMRHSLTSLGLNLNIQANPSTKDGQPGVTTYTFTPNKTGNFSWKCIDPCDTSNGQWAMFHNGYMMGTITVSNTATTASQTANPGANTSNGENDSGMMGSSSGMMNGQTGEGMGSMMEGGY